MSDTIWKLGAFLFAAAALPVSYVVMLMVSGGFDGAPVMRFLGALLAFMIALGIAAVYRRSHGDEAGSLERFWYLWEVGFRRGTVGPNKYGPDPLQK